MHVLVTGGAGFIGGNLVARLLADPDVSGVTVLDDLSTGSLANVPEGATVHVGSVLDPWALMRACTGADRIVHLAALASVARSVNDPLSSHDANTTGTLRVLEAARLQGGCPVIVASSSSVYGANPSLPKHERLRPEPVSPYAVGKLAAEAYALAYQRCYGLPTLVFRFFNVFGPLQSADHAYAAAIPSFLSAAADGRPIPIHGDGTQTRDFTYVGSLVSVIVDALRRGVVAVEPINLAFGTRRSLLEVVAELSSVLGRPLDIDWQPPRPGDVAHSQADASRLYERFPDIEPIDFQTGLRATAAWFLGRDEVRRPVPA